MRVLLLLGLVGCGRAEAGDLWLAVDTTKSAGEEVHLNVPANWLAVAEEPVWVMTTSGQVDLRHEARALKERKAGSEVAYTLADGALTLRNVAAVGAPAGSLELTTTGPKGKGFTLTMELEPEQLGVTHGQLDAVVDLDGLKLDVDEQLCQQLRASPPTEILRTRGPAGGGIRLATR